MNGKQCSSNQLFLFAACLLFGSGTVATQAATLHVPGFVEVNQYPLPTGIAVPLGDILFSRDGTTLFVLGGSESSSSGVWSVPVVRDAAGNVTGFGPASLEFLQPQMDTGLEIKPGTDTLFFRIGGGEIGQRRPDGSIETFVAVGAATTGGLAIVPDPLPNAGDLLVGDYNSGTIQSHFLVDNSDQTFTPMLQGLYSSSEFGATGDLQFVPTGNFTNDLMFTNWNMGTVSIIDIDPQSGTPVGGGAAPIITLFASGLGNGPWGLAFDPVSGDLFIANFMGTPANGLVQVSGFPPPNAVNRPPTAVCQDMTVPADIGICTAAMASVDAGSFDPDGDPITLAQTPAGPYLLGSTPVTLTVTDSSSASQSCAAVVTVVDQMPPTITASLDRIAWKKEDGDEARYEVSFSAVDNCGLTSPTTAVLSAPGCAPVPVANGAVVEFELEKKSCEVKFSKGVIKIEATRLTLNVTAEDATGFTTVSVDAVLPPDDDDDSD